MIEIIVIRRKEEESRSERASFMWKINELSKLQNVAQHMHLTVWKK